MATGYGLDDNVMEAYRFLVENYNNGKATDGERDRIFIFGFSRGAYSARVLAGFIRAVGLIAPRNLNLLRYAYRAYKRIGEQDDEDSFADPHNSMTSAWPVLEYLPLPPGPNSRRPRFAGLTIARHEPRFVPVNARLHGSVIARAEKIGALPDHIPAQYRIEGDPDTWG